MPRVDLKPNESQQQLFRRFRKVIIQSGVLSDVRKKRWFISRSEEQRMARKKAMRRQRQNLSKQRD